jgi:hypothetical protein
MLTCADLGIIMDIPSSDVSKEAANMILVDDNFASCMQSVKESVDKVAAEDTGDKGEDSPEATQGKRRNR